MHILQFWIANGIQNGLFIFVNEQNNGQTCLFFGTNHDLSQPNAQRLCRIFNAIFKFPLTERPRDFFRQPIRLTIIHAVERHVQHGVLRPVLFKPFNCKPIKQRFFAFKIGFERRKQQAFPETSRPRQKVVFGMIDQPEYDVCLIDVCIAACTDRFK